MVSIGQRAEMSELVFGGMGQFDKSEIGAHYRTERGSAGWCA
jgi:hypothetical protein